MSAKKKKITTKREMHQELLLCGGKSKEVEESCTDLSNGEKNDVQSQKRQRINQSLTSKLHTLTSTEQIVLPARISGRVTGSKNSNVWDFKMGSSNRETSSQKNKSVGYPAIPPVIPCVENLRHRYVSESRDYLKKLCKEHSVIPPLMAWERWQANCLLTQQISFRDSDASSSSANIEMNFTSSNNIYSRKVRSNILTAVDLILPDNIGNPDPGIVEDLIRGGLSDEMIACKVSKQMSDHSHDLVTKIRNFEVACRASLGFEKNATVKKQKGKLQQNNADTIYTTLPTVIEHKHTFDVYLGKNSKRILKLNCAHCMKLKELYFLNQQQTGNMESSSAMSETNASTTESVVDDKEVAISMQGFHCALYNLLARYNALLGHGMQCALPEDVFQVLHKWVQTNFECFASPLNCRYSSYCSAFPDTDTVFGSKGSFFDFYPSRGSYEVNPPFIESVMTAAVQHAHSLLEKSSDALSFVFIMPGVLISRSSSYFSETCSFSLSCVFI
jgi:Phosphorylated CTD interacting factor 1 WW domain